ncbi:malto-oligosyltrehalose synthase [Sphingobium sufflavum]|uniref:malto-oligosyltrehalose synthase n=1 Tax=Sphingobium sufflavum TaxID=1129547 RepID=UPI001F453D26|nr:malto-oligosyltrehalose synthase [Sphingobium sufflavum]MCE7795978.1 malto-oligosyltrehalose synthase [Sphingobium sufflavum]
MTTPSTIPRATYRLQLHAGFPFAEAEAIVPYLADLGISHVYASPITMAASGSTHGYDVIDPTRINPELGGESGLRSLVATLKAHGMALIIDIVPNHMGVAGDENRWWMDVLANGRDSIHAATFDIDWGDIDWRDMDRGEDQPITLPILGVPLPEALVTGVVRLVETDSRLGVEVHGGSVYPIRPDDPVFEEVAPLATHDPASESGRAALSSLLARQHYRLVYWRGAHDNINWRRFFSINELAGVRVEDPAVFAATHRLVFDLFRDGLIDGVRVDHVDGLADPAAYGRALRAGFAAIAPDRPAYIVVEKILAADEPLAIDWGVDGTSGYDFMREVAGLLHDPAGEAPLRALWAGISGRTPDFEEEALAARRDLLSWQFEGQLCACVDSFVRLSRAAGQTWMTGGMLRRAIERLLWIFPVYRTYGTGTDAPASDRAIRDAARRAVAPLVPPGEGPVIDFILDRLAGAPFDHADSDPPVAPDLAADAVRRFQQLSAPIAAKGVEDTAFYRQAVLLSANDVGFDPARIALPVADFHAAMQARAATHPHAMLATATHDHKRGEDARARLAVLSAIPALWAAQVRDWLALVQAQAEGIDPADLYQLFQALVGAWREPDDALTARIHGWQEKMLREAKLRSSWEAPDEAYEERYRAMATALLAEGSVFRADFVAFMARIAPAALANSLTQTLLHYSVPGVPDCYQGCELMDYSTVDPGNRDPVDYATRRTLLATQSETPGESGAGTGDATKLALVRQLLALRRDHPRLFAQGDYRPLPVTGSRATHVIAFTRTQGDETLFCAAALHLGAPLVGTGARLPDGDWWGDTMIGTGDGAQPASALFARKTVHVALSTATN